MILYRIGYHCLFNLFKQSSDAHFCNTTNTRLPRDPDISGWHPAGYNLVSYVGGALQPWLASLLEIKLTQ